MRACLTFVWALGGCGVFGGQPVSVPERSDVRLVGCTPALAPPLTSSDGTRMFGGLLEEEITTVPTLKPIPADVMKRGSVSLGMPRSSPAIDLDLVRRVVQTKVPELRACFDRQLVLNASVTHTQIHWTFWILQDGKVSNASPTSPAMSMTMETCVSRTLKTMTFPARATGGTVTVTMPLVFDAIPVSAPRPPPAAPSEAPHVAWTPFAADTSPVALSGNTMRAAEGAVRGKLAAIDACFDAKSPRGSIRALLQLDGKGQLAMARAGGLGVHAIESCIEKAVAGLRVITPTTEIVEVACDLARGDARSWRVTPDAGYGIIAATRKQLRYGDQVLVRGAADPTPLTDAKAFVVLAEPDTPGSMLELALAWASNGTAALIALREGGGPPLFLGMGRIAISQGDDASDPGAVHPTLRLGQQTLTACIGRGTQQAKLSEPAAVGALLQRVATKCRAARCSASLVVALDADAIARDLVEVTGAARRAGFERVLLGGEDRCHAVEPQLEAEDEEDDS